MEEVEEQEDEVATAIRRMMEASASLLVSQDRGEGWGRGVLRGGDVFRTLPDGEEKEEEEEDAMLAEKDGAELSFILHSRPGQRQRPPPLTEDDNREKK